MINSKNTKNDKVLKNIVARKFSQFLRFCVRLRFPKEVAALIFDELSENRRGEKFLGPESKNRFFIFAF